MVQDTGLKAKFSGDEWALVRTLPFQMFLLVAFADGEMDSAESKFFDENFRSGAFGYKDPLLREMASDFYASGDPVTRLVEAAVEAWKEGGTRLRIRQILEQHLTSDEYQRFMGSLVLLGRDTANASGGKSGVFKKIDPMSQEELGAMQQFVVAYGVDLTAIPRLLG